MAKRLVLKIPVRIKRTVQLKLKGSLNCPHCGMPLRYHLQRTGEIVRCRQCDARVRV